MDESKIYRPSILTEKKINSLNFREEKTFKKQNNEIHLPKTTYKFDSNKNLDCSRNIKYLYDLIDRNEICIKKVIHDQDKNKYNQIMEENKIDINDIDKQPKIKKLLNNCKGNIYYYL